MCVDKKPFVISRPLSILEEGLVVFGAFKRPALYQFINLEILLHEFFSNIDLPDLEVM